MMTEQLINYDIPVLTLNDNAQKALLWMEEMRVSQLPVVDNKQYLGMLSEDQVLNLNYNLDHKISDFELSAKNSYVGKNQHLYDIVSISTEFDLDLIAVVNNDGTYEGVVPLNDAIRSWASTVAITEQGGILVLKLKGIDYSLSEISRLVESNNAKILHVSMSIDKANPHMILITLKINKVKLDAVVATFKRFDYNVLERYDESNMDNSNERDRINLLMKFLDI